MLRDGSALSRAGASCLPRLAYSAGADGVPRASWVPNPASRIGSRPKIPERCSTARGRRRGQASVAMPSVTAMAAEEASVSSTVPMAAAITAIAAVRSSVATRIAVPTEAAVAAVRSAMATGMAVTLTLSGSRI